MPAGLAGSALLSLEFTQSSPTAVASQQWGKTGQCMKQYAFGDAVGHSATKLEPWGGTGVRAASSTAEEELLELRAKEQPQIIEYRDDPGIGSTIHTLPPKCYLRAEHEGWGTLRS